LKQLKRRQEEEERRRLEEELRRLEEERRRQEEELQQQEEELRRQADLVSILFISISAKNYSGKFYTLIMHVKTLPKKY
jgi:ubiquitin-protein ligase